jgi:phage gpG-like protein
MDPKEFERLIKQKAKEIEDYANTHFPTEAGNEALRFINENFRKQGYQGASLQPWKKNKRGGTILVKSGHLRSATYFTTQPGQATVRNTLPYAAIHNEGGTIDKTVTVKEHTRKQTTAKFGKSGRKLKGRELKGKATVRSHSRKMNLTMPRRQFAPTADSPSTVLNDAVARKIEAQLKRIFD